MTNQKEEMTLYITHKTTSWADHRTSDNHTEILSTTTDIFTAYAIAIEAWVEEYVMRNSHEADPSNWGLFHEISEAIQSNEVSYLAELHDIFTEYADSYWRNEYGGAISFYIEIEEQVITPIQKTVNAPGFLEHQRKANIWNYLKDNLDYEDVKEYSSFINALTVDITQLNKPGFVERLSHLTNLKVLKIQSSYNNTDEIPEDIGLLQSLRELNIHFNGSTIPNSIGNLTLLEEFSISSPQHSLKIATLPDSFGNLSQLQSLNIRDARHFNILPDNFSQLSSLRRLYLDCCNISSLPENFGELQNLEVLSISHNSEQVTLSIPDSFSQLQNLQDLSLSHVQELPDSFGSLISLKQLTLSKAKLTQLPESFATLHLEKLTIYNSLPLPNAFDTIAMILSLTELTLQCELTHIPKTIQHCKKLIHLNLLGNNIETIPDEMGELINLTHLILARNNIVSISKTLTSLEMLRFFNISDNPTIVEEDKKWLKKQFDFIWI